MAVVAKILDQDAYFAGRREMELVALEIQSCLIGANKMRDQIFVGGAIVQDLDVFRRLDEDPGVGGKTGR
jgi:hypothetical protein